MNTGGGDTGGGRRARGEVAASALVVADVLHEITGTVHDMHRAIARRTVVQLLPRPVRTAAEVATSAVYGLVKGGISVVGGVAAVALDSAERTRTATPWSTSPRGRRLAGVLDGSFGDRLAGRHPALAGPLRIRQDGVDVEPEADALAAHFPATSGTVVVFLHGLIENEEWWGDPATVGGDFPTRLARDLGCSSVLIRYNSGRHVSENGAALAELLERLVAAWPCPVEEIALVGHSMGGLVARSAVHQGAERGDGWTGSLRHVVCLGSPLTGAPLERGANALTWLLRRFDESAPLAELLAARSAGVKDMRHGSIHHRDWQGVDPDALRRATPTQPYQPPITVQHSNVAATLSRDPGRLGHWIGDILVPTASALAAEPPARTHRMGGLGHFALLTHDEVYERLLEWLRS